MTVDLEAKKALVVAERQQFEKEKQEIADLVKLDSDVVALNVGGTHHMMTERQVLALCPESVLSKMFSGNH
jgi:hypothetical protein